MEVVVTKPFRHYLRIFESGTVGVVVEVAEPLTFLGRPIYDLYVKFTGYVPVGVFWSEVRDNSKGVLR